jgi:hypothetical protein
MLAMSLLVGAAVRPAWAGPQDVDLYAMLDHDGEAVIDREVLGASFRQLATELGTLVASSTLLPASTTGLYGFEVDFGAQFVLTEAHDRKGAPSPWTRANPEEDSAVYQLLPSMTVRKGLPLSTEIGATLGWIGGTSTGSFGAFGRVAVLEGFKPLPDVTLQLGYSGYVGNDQLDVGALDLGVTVGSTFPTGRLPGVNTGAIAPWATFRTLRIRADPTIEPEVEEALGALRYAGGGAPDEPSGPPIAVPQVGAGVQFVSGNAHLRISASWAPATIPALGAGFGFTF